MLWFRRDLRLRDLPALLTAARRSPRALALYVLDDTLLRPAGKPRLDFLHGCLRTLSGQLDGRLLVVRGDPVREVPRVAEAVEASSVHVSTDTGPYGRRRDGAVAAALAKRGVEWVETGSPYAVTPGRVRKADGEPYRVFTPFYRAWLRHGWRGPADSSASTVEWIEPPLRGESVADGPDPLFEPGEAAAMRVWERFLDERLDDYGTDRDRPDRPGTTLLSPYLRWGCVHPRTLLADLPDGAEALRSELAWREFHADVLWHRPETARRNYDERFDRMRHDSGPGADEAFRQWREGRTGFPIVDAGMRQLLAEGWMHNRVRMIVASFLVKDLHLPWWWGARHFMRHLVDGDLASNQLNWQWVAGSGTDAAPYFRVFNPTTQGRKFDPDGDYVRRYVAELRAVPGRAVHEPVKLDGGCPEGYPPPMVDHAEERQEALARYGAVQDTSRAARRRA
ncbi:deoxyribodipyrimidine photo-lyase [Amycolatopsis suaedae]|uniref:Deoxyribodipyrimidine photo-lyase n=1 Tax=Amycolatopsis suaedae TaxID=2510978 RepID=A0A4Q7J9D6_9PSEU|nr:deoxyribodipyrimidine photo-lyase [Amycolatopsis suaedae]